MPRVSSRNSFPRTCEREGEGGGERVGQGGVHLLDGVIGEALLPQALRGDTGGAVQGPVTQAVAHDVLDLLFRVAEPAQGRRQRGVDDLEVAAAGQLLELHQAEVRLDARRVAVHDQADRARGRDGGDLRVAVAVLLPEGQRPVPRAARRCHQVRRAEQRVDGLRDDREALVLLRGRAVGGPPVVADDAQHVVAVGREPGERSELGRHLRRGGVRLRAEDGGEGRRDGAAFRAVVGDAHDHEKGAEVGVAQAQGAEVVALARDFLRGELRHEHADLQHDGPQPDGVAKVLDADLARLARRRRS